MKIRFVCSANLNRSPRAARFLRAIADKEGWKDIEINSAGTKTEDVTPEELRARGREFVTQLTDEMLRKEDIIIAFDSKIEQDIRNNYEVMPKRMITLGVSDHKNLLFVFDEILEQKLGDLIEKIRSEQKGTVSKEID
jgi:protein-tyrosine-phosphatase